MEKMENEILMTSKLSFVRRAIVREWASAKFDVLGADVLLTVPSFPSLGEDNGLPRL